MRVVTNSSPLWREPGVGSTHVAALFGYDDYNETTPLKLWADRVSLRRRNKMKAAPQLEQGSSDWLQWRAAGVGGSEVASVCREGRFGSPQSVWKEKVAAKRGEPVSGGFENEHMKRGKALEPIARAEYERLMGWRCDALCVIHDDYDFVRCSLDGIRDDGQLVLEIKSPGAKNHAKSIEVRDSNDPEQFHRQIPNYYCQVQYQLLITGAPMAHFVSYNQEPQFDCGNRLVLIEIPANGPYQDEVLSRVKDFWLNYVETEIPPNGV